MNDIQMTPGNNQMLNQARSEAKNVLAQSDVFKAMSLDDQKNIYKLLVDESLQKQMEKSGVATALATDSGKDMGYKGYDPALGGDTRAFTELVESVDFPKFVADLLKAVFDANLKVMKQQTDSYIKLMKEATKSSAEFIKKIKDDESFAKLAETKGDKYNVTTEKQSDGSMKLALTNPQGEKVDNDDAIVKQHILETKIMMAKEHRAALREVLLMGVTRLVVEKGEIEAGVEFKIKATRESKAHHDDQNINVLNMNAGVDFGIGSASMDMTKTNIQINTSDKKATDDLSATLKGSVKIHFKTDYFKLDNFANMYADGGVAALKPAPQGQLPGGVPQR